MKPLDNLNNVEKARLLHQLCPAEIPALLLYIDGLCDTIVVQEQAHRSQWNNGLFSFDFWLSLVRSSGSKIRHYGKKLYSNSGLFADQLFDGYSALYMVHGIDLYNSTGQCTDPKFAQAAALLFSIGVKKDKTPADTAQGPAFVNGFESWHETHYEIVISMSPDREGSLSCQRREQQGTGGLYELAQELTDEFEYLNAGREWDGEFFDEIYAFIKAKNL